LKNKPACWSANNSIGTKKILMSFCSYLITIKKMRHSKSFFLIALLIIAISCSDEEPTPKAELVVEDLNLTIDENPEVNQVLGVIAVENSEGSLAFTLTNQIPNGAMSINTTSGELIVADTALFNFEANPQITAQVNVTDMNSSGSAMITINLKDVDESFMFTIWSGPELNFTKADNADPNLVENQDEISASVAITRGNTGGQIYNAKLETSANKIPVRQVQNGPLVP